MADDLMRRPWRIHSHARALADLHRRLHAIAPPDWLEGAGPAILHLDLPPKNVLLWPSGTAVIDWANTERGVAGRDLAVSAVILAGEPLRPPVAWLRDAFLATLIGVLPRDRVAAASGWRPDVSASRPQSHRRAAHAPCASRALASAPIAV